MNNTQNIDANKVITKLLNKLAMQEFKVAKLEVQLEEANARVTQLTEANQRLQFENNKKDTSDEATAKED